MGLLDFQNLYMDWILSVYRSTFPKAYDTIESVEKESTIVLDKNKALFDMWRLGK